jgi:hypothetical protein
VSLAMLVSNQTLTKVFERCTDIGYQQSRLAILQHRRLTTTH